MNLIKFYSRSFAVVFIVELFYLPMAYGGPIASRTRLAAKEILRSDPGKAAQLFLESCNAGAGISCRDYAKLIEAKGQFRQAARYYGWACLALMPESCLLSGKAWLKGGAFITARKMFAAGCKLKLADACAFAKRKTLDRNSVSGEKIDSRSKAPQLQMKLVKLREELNKPIDTTPPVIDLPAEKGFDYWQEQLKKRKKE